MPKKKGLTEHQKRAMGKLGLMPFTNEQEIIARFGTPHSFLRDIQRTRSNSLTERLKRIERFTNDPATAKLVMHPKLWMVYRMRELAPTHTVTEIRDILLRERENNPHLSRVEIPASGGLSAAIQKLNFRTPEQGVALRTRKRRALNELTPEQRAELVQVAEPFIANICKWARDTYGDELATIIRDYISDDVAYAQLDPSWPTEKRRKKWLAYLREGRRYFFLASLTRYKRRTKGKKLLSLRPDDTEAMQPTKEENPFLKEISFTTKLSKREREVLQLLKEGKNLKEVAKALQTGYSNVNAIRQSIRRKIKK